jgi:hypothetical protein
MAFLTGFQHDVFVSYARADDIVDASGRGWVSQFVDSLTCALKQRLGGSKEIRVFFDTTDLSSNQQLNELLETARRTALFLAIASRSYAERNWTKLELEAFIAATGDTHRLFAAECLPLDGSPYPPPLDQHNRMPFYRNDPPHSETSIRIPLSPSDTIFHQRIHNLAEQMQRQLRKLQVDAANPAQLVKDAVHMPARRGSNPMSEFRRVLLAQVTEDLDEERELVRSYLEQSGVPIAPLGTYPQGGAEFKTSFEADLKQADLFVQLVSASAGRKPPDLPEGYTRFQHAAADGKGIAILQWRRPDLDPEHVADAEHRELLKGGTVMAVGLEAFKAEVVRRAKKPVAPPAKKPRSSLVFLDADNEDLDIAKLLQSEFSKHQFATAVPTLAGTAEEIRADLEENLLDCDALVFIYGQTSSIWVRGQFRLFNKLQAKRSHPPRMLALYNGPPQHKAEVGFHLPAVREIDCRAGVKLEPIEEIIEELSR